MNVAQLIDDGIPADEAGPIATAWNQVYPSLRGELTAIIKSGTARGTDVTEARQLRLELGQLDRCTHRPCTQSPPGFAPYYALRLLHDGLRLLPRYGLSYGFVGDLHRLAALLADRALVQYTIAAAERHANQRREPRG